MAWGTIIGITLLASLILQTATLADGEWCVVAPYAEDGPLQDALNWVCSAEGGHADCRSIQPDGACFLPDTLRNHASYAFNDYWKYHKAIGATCDFNGLAIEVLTDPSHDNCHFL